MIQWTRHQMRFGEKLKPFYLPVNKDIRSDSWNCYIFPVAPFVLAGSIMYRVFMNVWFDLVCFLEVQTELINIKRRRRATGGDVEVAEIITKNRNPVDNT